MCDIDELEYAEYQLYATARIAPPIPDEPVRGHRSRGASERIVPTHPVEA